ncbi:MAG: exodeoxyribonuclease I [Gammaproteobacteria bacterium]|nr:exodeoxyribonuclease I [Gammaproteobacteria bacterium]
MNADTFLFYDLETSGTNPRHDRILQFACVRTDAQLREVEPPVSFYVKLPIDILPDPAACVVTGLTPQKVNAQGMPELEAHVEIRRHLSLPGTCAVGYNSLRFDDEFVRHGFFRHFIDPYAREWQGGNSRWDLIDLTRATAALRPQGIEWPQEDGLPSFRLEALTAANRIEHAGAHDALVDVRATVALARLLKSQQPKLFEYYLGLRRKKSAAVLLSANRPQMCLHVSGMFGRERHCIAPVLPIAVHPTNANSVIVADLGRDVRSLLDWDAARHS